MCWIHSQVSENLPKQLDDHKQACDPYVIPNDVLLHLFLFLVL